jgi:hypothetical protein
MHLASFVEAPERAAFFINVTSLRAEGEIEVTHVWIETAPRTHATPDARPLPVRLRPLESWETWIYVDELPSVPGPGIYDIARVRLSTGEILASKANVDVPEIGFVPGASRGRA